MQVSWMADGERQIRPLTAFSSGEQALAYTRARMARLDMTADSAANRLIVLDEFGAFIAADRMRHLTRYLLDRRKSFPRDQIVVVLPLRDEIPPDRSSQDSAGAERWGQLEERGYIAERITR